MKTLSYDKFFFRTKEAYLKDSRPFAVTLELTYRCNYSCAYCYVPLNYISYGEMSFGKIKKIIDAVVSAGCLFLGLTGGEIFLRKDIMRIIGYARKKGLEVVLYTNGSLINSYIALELAHLRINRVDITLPGYSRRIFEHISGARGSRERTFRAIRLLHSAGVPVSVKTTVIKDNVREISAIRNFAAGQGLSFRTFRTVNPRLDGSREPLLYALPNSGRKNGFISCAAGKVKAVITPWGELKPCILRCRPAYRLKPLQDKGAFSKTWGKMARKVSLLRRKREAVCQVCNTTRELRE